jgi:hypothetical protein
VSTLPNGDGGARGCDGCASETIDEGVHNRPGLNALSYRVGTYRTFLNALLARLPTETDGQEPAPGAPAARPLAGLNSAAPNDPLIALLDATAVVGDVLTFYQERIANEGFLRTASERRSVLELARGIGYELGPGVAASTYLAFTLDDHASSPRSADLPVGTQVQSVPGPNEVAQTFETVEAITARVEWNTLRPRATQPQTFVAIAGELRLSNADASASVPATHLYVRGTSSGVKAGDWVLALAAGTPLPARVLEVLIDDHAKLTTLRIAAGDVSLPPLPSVPYPPPATSGVIEASPLRLEPAVVSEKILDEVWDEQSLQAFCAIQRWDPAELIAVVDAIRASKEASSELFAFRQRLGCFGHNAPPYAQVNLPPVVDSTKIAAALAKLEFQSYTTFQAKTSEFADELTRAISGKPPVDSDDWDAHPRSIWQDSHGVSWLGANRPFDTFLERALPNLVGGWVLFEVPSSVKAFEIVKVGEQTLTEFSIAARATGLRLAIASSEKHSTFMVRSTTAHVQSEALPLAALPVIDPLEDASATPARGASALELDRMVLGLRPGQVLLLSGVSLGDDGEPSGLWRSEAVTLATILHANGFTTLYFETALAWRYVRSTVTLSANVALSTHGQTVPVEILGSGDAALEKQRFTLQKAPLTWVSATTPSGRKSTLSVRVDDTEWTELPSLYGVDPESQSYTLRTNDDGRATVIFSRLPTGTGNVVASYRSGLGLAGQVPAGSLTTLLSRPLGVKAVVNPLRATGAADPESRDSARSNAPVSVLTLERIVSLLDYENFARAFAGVGKAQAVALWDGQTQLIHLSVAAADGTPLEAGTALASGLAGAIAKASDGRQRVRVDGYLARYFRVEAGVTLDPRLESAAVLAQVEAALHAAFGFANRQFGQRVTSADVVTVIQSVRGVVACTLTALALLTAAGSDAGTGVTSILSAELARFDGAIVTPAEILMLSPSGVKLFEQGAP